MDKEITYREAVRMGIRKAMSEDERVFLMGEDVGRYGGSYAVSTGLLEEFGNERHATHSGDYDRELQPFGA